MASSIPRNMRAVVIERYGGPEQLHAASVPVPVVGDKDVLIQVETAGIGSWDPWIVEGGMGGGEFPLVLGTDGAGKVVAVGQKVKRFQIGDRVYGYSLSSSKGGFFAEYTSVPEDNLALVPGNLAPEEAGALGAIGVTAIIGLEKLGLNKMEKLLVFGASGGVGHVTVELAKRMGADVLAVASGKDGAEMVRSLGADVVIDGKTDDVEEAVDKFAPNGLDAAIAFVGGPELDQALAKLKERGRLAYPLGVEPEPKVNPGVKVIAYNGLPGPEVFAHLNQLIAAAPFRVHISRTYSMGEMPRAMADVQKHHLGKLALAVKTGPKNAASVPLKARSG